MYMAICRMPDLFISNKITMKDNFNNLTKAVSILKTIAHPIRLAVLKLLAKEGRMNVNSMQEILGCEQSSLSHHLGILKANALLKTERQGQYIFYMLNEEERPLLLQCLKIFTYINDDREIMNQSSFFKANN